MAPLNPGVYRREPAPTGCFGPVRTMGLKHSSFLGLGLSENRHVSSHPPLRLPAAPDRFALDIQPGAA